MGSLAYVRLMLALIAAALVPAAGLNLLLITNSVGTDKNRMASDWQQATRGVTYAPPISQNRPFKTLRLNDRISEINAVVFGSSTVMGIRQDIFPPPLVPYNFAQTGNSLRIAVGEAEYVAGRWGSTVRLLVIPLDWALGFVQEAGVPVRVELSPEAMLKEAARARPSLAARVTEALSAPRMRMLLGILRDVLKAPNAAVAFRQVILDPAGPEYRCPDGAPARDFDVVSRGLCNGFRHDGSATFADQKRLDAGRGPAALAAAVSGGSQYSAALKRGAPNLALLDAIAQLARRTEALGGRVVVVMPPLMPGMEEALARTEHGGDLLRATKAAVKAWSARERIALLDAGRSETYGCVAAEFIDAHHALPECYRKVFSRFFAGHASLPKSAAAASR